MQTKTRTTSVYSLSFTIVGLIVTLFMNDNRSQWLDESMLSNNILFKTFKELLGPLTSHQSAPIGYVLLQKILLYINPYKEFSLRLPSLMAYAASIYLFHKTMCRLFSSKHIQFIATVVFLLNLWIIRYSFEVKPYIFDVLAGIVYLYFYGNDKVKDIHRIVGYSILIFFSNTAVVLIAGDFLCDLFIFKKRSIKFLLSKYSVPGIVFIINFVLYFLDNPNKEFMLAYWGNANAFPPQNIFSGAFWVWMSDFVIKSIGLLIGYDLLTLSALDRFKNFFPIISISVFTVCGFLVFKAKNKNLIIACSIPIAIHLICAALKLYPADYRLCLYMVPLLIVVFFTLILSIIKSDKLLYAMILPYISLCVAKYPYHISQIKQGLDYIEAKSPQQVHLVVNVYASPTVGMYINLKEYHKIHPDKLTTFKEEDKLNGAFMANIPHKQGQKYYALITVIPPDMESVMNAFRTNTVVFDYVSYKGCIVVGFEFK